MEDDLPFRAEYAKSGRSSCKKCKLNIAQGTLRLGVVLQSATFDGKIPSWYHFDCFFERQRPKSAGDIEHFDQLRWEDQERINEKIRGSKIEDTVDGGGPSGTKKIKKEDKENEQQTEEIKNQNKILFKYRDQLVTLKKKELQAMLKYNDQQIPQGTSEILDHLSDVMTFGALLPCSECKTGQLYYRSGIGYQCSGYISDWTKCAYTTTMPEWKSFKVPPELAEEYSFLKEYKNVPRQRVIPAKTLTVRKDTTCNVVSTGKSNSGMSEKRKLKMKGGGVVDPDSGLEDKAQVLETRDCLYSVVLLKVDIQGRKNSYYKIQVLEHDNGNEWTVFRSWGRVGDTIGKKKKTPMYSKQEAIDYFVVVYEKKTGNLWENRHNFEKKHGKYYICDVDYGEVKTAANSKSKLQKSVQDLICMLFDVEAMNRTLIEFELDLTKMPLGKLSKKQVEKAYGILSQAQELLDSKAVSKTKLVDVSNQFYTLIPHDFGRKTPPVLDNCEIIKSKLDMLQSLMEIIVAFNLLAGDAVKDKDPIDAHYEKLNTEIELLDKSSEEFKLIQTYAKNTHGATHTQYTLEVEEVFKVVRKGESKRFRPFSKLPNRRLLWHGSRVSNVAGILSQGLRIAPPEAPVTGYMFGKGIYFADMFSKSANYCKPSKNNPVGLILLCDVALGNCYERKKADSIEKLKEGYQSVLGVGKTQPNPEESKMLGDVKVPLGKPVTAKVKDTSLLYNEYIVYDVAQVNIKYLVKTKFHYQ